MLRTSFIKNNRMFINKTIHIKTYMNKPMQYYFRYRSEFTRPMLIKEIASNKLRKPINFGQCSIISLITMSITYSFVKKQYDDIKKYNHSSYYPGKINYDKTRIFFSCIGFGIMGLFWSGVALIPILLVGPIELPLLCYIANKKINKDFPELE